MPASDSYSYTLSPYAETVELIRKDIRDFLAIALDLPTPYKSSDPLLGERYIGMMPITLRDNPGTNWIEGYKCQVIISGAFRDVTGQAAHDWAVRTTMNFHHLLPQIKLNVNQRGIFYEFEKLGDFNPPRPRNPAKTNGSIAPSDIWVVDVAAACEMKLIIPVDSMTGHL